ncbi:MAG: Na+/H+ antiporter NhaA [Actinomycetota bacterium]|jgi:NhaA family Na+:H+ antiporter|nr:Na+/H+ antiporter NhaA [Actinomycetota bacterium]
MSESPPSPRLSTPWSRTSRAVPRTLVQPLQAFLHTEVAGGVVLVVAAIVALVWANSPLSESYVQLWATELAINLGPLQIAEDLGHWVNDLLMALFFFVVGLEIKRELVHGELHDPRAAALPLLCALGGMVAPALLYAAINAGGPGSSGWGIPMATDIAFALGVLALVGSRAPAGLKVFLLTLAVVDDLGAILVIAIFYSSGVAASWLAVAAATVIAILILRRIGVRSLTPYAIAAAVLWLAIYSSGVHATIAGVILGLLTPAWPFHPPEAVTGSAAGHLQELGRQLPDGVSDEREQTTLLEVSRLANEAVSPMARLEAKLHPWSSFVVLPLFALANAGVALRGPELVAAFSSPISLGIAAGLILGKPLGIMLAGWIAVRTGLTRLPDGVGWLEMLGVSGLAGIGFTVSIFIAGLAFDAPEAVDVAKVGILIFSVLAGMIGAAALAARDASKRPDVTAAE